MGLWLVIPVRLHYRAGIESHCYKYAPHFIDSINQDCKSPNLFSTKSENVQNSFRHEYDPSCWYGVKHPTLTHWLTHFQILTGSTRHSPPGADHIRPLGSDCLCHRLNTAQAVIIFLVLILWARRPSPPPPHSDLRVIGLRWRVRLTDTPVLPQKPSFLILSLVFIPPWLPTLCRWRHNIHRIQSESSLLKNTPLIQTFRYFGYFRQQPY